MLSVDEALLLILENARPLGPEPTRLSDALGRILAEAITSDVDSPPHDKSIVDGYALIASDPAESGVKLAVLEEVTAGAVPTRTVERGTAVRIMTGAPLPAGADAVVMVEKTELAGDVVKILESPVRPGQNIMRRASSLRRGQAVLEQGMRLRAIELGILAEVGKSSVATLPAPRVAIIATGNELVEPSMVPAPGQIRNSNGPLLHGLVIQAGGSAVPLGIARDDESDLKRLIENGLGQDVVVLAGGVSAGVLDLVPKVLAGLGVKEVFHKVNVKPGKPVWFGIKPNGVAGQTLVFGLPGNPVSALVCFELFVRPAVAKLQGLPAAGLPRAAAKLAREHQQRGERETYWPGRIQESGVGGQRSEFVVTPLDWKGSGDLSTLAGANCLAHFPAGDRRFVVGEEIQCLLLPLGLRPPAPISFSK